MLIFWSKISRLHLLALHAIKNCNSCNWLFSHCHFSNRSYVLIGKEVSRLFLGSIEILEVNVILLKRVELMMGELTMGGNQSSSFWSSG